MDIYEYWKNNFVLIKQEKYRDCNLSDNTKRILCDVGLPEEPIYFIHFNVNQADEIRYNEKNMVIGDDFGTDICIGIKEEIVSVDPRHVYPVRFINTSLECFIRFIIIFLSFEEKITDADDDEINMILNNVREEFDRVDRQALLNEENWWPVVLEQIEGGLM